MAFYKKLPILLIFAFLVYLAFCTYIIATVPFFIGDESNYANAYLEFVKTGRPDIYGELVVKPAGMFVLSCPFLQPLLGIEKFLGLGTEIPFRVVSMLFGAGALAVLYYAFLKLSGSEEAAGLGVLVFMLNPNFLLTSAIYYPDSFLQFFAFLSLAALHWKEDWKGSALGGLFCGIAFYIKMQQAFLVLAIALPLMLLRKKIRLDYFLFCAIFCALAAVLAALPYYPARLEQLMLLVNTELFARAGFGWEGVWANAVGLVSVYAAAIPLFFLMLIYSLKLARNEDFRFEYSQVALLLAFMLLVSSYFYTSMLFFGFALLCGRLYARFWKIEKIAIFAILALVLLNGHAAIMSFTNDPSYDFESQKNLGKFLAGKYPVTFVTEIPQMGIWRVYETRYLWEGSPLLLANMRMGVPAYKFMDEGGSRRLGEINAVYYNNSLTPVSQDLEGRLGKYVVLENRTYEKYKSRLGGYEKIADFGSQPGFLAYELQAKE